MIVGSRLEDRPTYIVGSSFHRIPFPDLPEGEIKLKLRDVGDKLDTHRKTQQAKHPDLTLTNIYNVLEKIRKQEPLTDKEKITHDHGLVTVLKQIHDHIDELTYRAYGRTDLWEAQQALQRGNQKDTAEQQENPPKPSFKASQT